MGSAGNCLIHTHLLWDFLSFLDSLSKTISGQVLSVSYSSFSGLPILVCHANKLKHGGVLDTKTGLKNKEKLYLRKWLVFNLLNYFFNLIE